MRPSRGFSILDATATAWDVDKSQILARLPEGTKPIAGTLVFKHEDGELKVLLLRRTSTDSFPLLWEHSAGGSDPEDYSFIDTAVRELWEETGLITRTVLSAVGSGFGSTPTTMNDPNPYQEYEKNVGPGNILLCPSPKQRLYAKMTFWVEVEDYQVILDKNEHVDWTFASEEEVINERCVGKDGQDIGLDFTTGGVKATILEGFNLARSGQNTSSVQLF